MTVFLGEAEQASGAAARYGSLLRWFSMLLPHKKQEAGAHRVEPILVAAGVPLVVNQWGAGSPSQRDDDDEDSWRMTFTVRAMPVPTPSGQAGSPLATPGHAIVPLAPEPAELVKL